MKFNPLVLPDGTAFLTKKAAADRVRQVIAAAGDVADEHVPFVTALLDRHPEREVKIGCGVDRFFIKTSRWGTAGLWLRRVDGSITDFSFLACLSPPSHAANIRRAFREAIGDQITAFKAQSFTTRVCCSLTGAHITSFAGAHVDHTPPQTFEALVVSFLRTQGLSEEAVLVSAVDDGVCGVSLSSPELEQSWRTWHRERARLRILSAAVNLSQPKA